VTARREVPVAFVVLRIGRGRSLQRLAQRHDVDVRGPEASDPFVHDLVFERHVSPREPE